MSILTLALNIWRLPCQNACDWYNHYEATNFYLIYRWRNKWSQMVCLPPLWLTTHVMSYERWLVLFAPILKGWILFSFFPCLNLVVCCLFWCQIFLIFFYSSQYHHDVWLGKTPLTWFCLINFRYFWAEHVAFLPKQS